MEPQQGTGASAYLNDAHNVGVSNNEVQTICSGQAAGSLYLHEGTLYNPLGYALVVDALQNPGPGDATRINLSTVCDDYLTPGLGLSNLLETESTLLIALVKILIYPNPTVDEPPIKSKVSYHHLSALSLTYNRLRHFLT